VAAALVVSTDLLYLAKAKTMTQKKLALAKDKAKTQSLIEYFMRRSIYTGNQKHVTLFFAITLASAVQFSKLSYTLLKSAINL